MNLFNAIGIGLKEIWAHKFRSLLTMLGIILGVSSLVSMSALVKGMENGMREGLIAIGGLEKVRVEQEDIPASQMHLADQAVGITIHDVHALQASAPLIKMVTPEMRIQRATATRGPNKFNVWNFIGTVPNAIDMNQHVIEHGRMFNELDNENVHSVCVIGTTIRDELFGSPEKVGHEIIPIGEQITVNGLPLTIIGMFDALTDKFSTVFRGLSGRGRISEENIRESMREVRTALLEADVNFKVVNDFTEHVIQKAIGQEVIKSLQPGQLMVKICYDELVNLMGPVDTTIYFVQPGPTLIMMCGLQGAGKTTTCGKLAMLLQSTLKAARYRRGLLDFPGS